MKRLPTLSNGRIASLLTACLLTVTLFASAQRYQPGVQLDDSLVVFVKKCSFKQAGEKLMVVTVDQDTTAKTQAVTVSVYNADLSLFKRFGAVRPMTDWIMYMHNGIDVVEHTTEGLPAYYWTLTSQSELDTTYTSYTTVLNETNTPLVTLPVSYHGHQTFVSDGRLKIAGDSVTWDTMQLSTTRIYDVASAVREATFPKGTRLRRALTHNDTLMLLTENPNMAYYLDEHPLGSKATCMNMIVYGADYQPLKTLTFDVDVFGAPDKDAINFVSAWEPLFDGQQLYFAHQMNYYIKDDQNTVLESRDRIFLTNANGQPLVNTDKVDRYPTKAIWLPKQQQTALLTYNGLVMNTNLDSLLVCNEAVVTEGGDVVFLLSNDSGIHVYNEALALQKTLEKPEGEWSYSAASHHTVNNDDLLEVVFTDGSNGLYIINEAGQVLANAPELHAMMEFMEYKPLIIRDQKRRHANIIDEDFMLWLRKAPLSANVVNGATTVPLAVQLFEVINGQPVLVDVSTATGHFQKDLPEGVYVLRTEPKDSYPGTYYPSGLLWETAQALTFTADSALAVDIEQLPALPGLSSQDAGVLFGSFSEVDDTTFVIINAPLVRRSSMPYSPFEQTHVYVKRVDNQALTAHSAVEVDAYRMEQLPLGQYQVLVDKPGKPMLETALVELTEAKKTVSLTFLVDVDGIRVGYNSALQAVKTDAFTVYPNPAVDHLRFDAGREGCRLEASDLSGRVLLSTTVTDGRVGLSTLAPGLYLVHLHTPEGVLTTRLIKQ